MQEETSMDKWDSRFMEMAHVIAGWTSCYRPGRSIGCVIVKDKRIMTTGYNGAPAGLKTCRERGECMRDRLGALLHAPAVQRLRKDDYQCRHPPCRVSGGLPGLLLAGYF